MRRIPHIALAAALAAMCVIPAAGQSYRRNKVKTEPEKLVIRKTIFVPDKNLKELLTILAGWDGLLPELDYQYTDRSYLTLPKKEYFGVFRNLSFANRPGDLFARIDIHVRAEGIILVFRDIDFVCGQMTYQGALTTGDDSFNRTTLWLARHKKVFDQARIRAQECFDYVAESLESYLNDGGPLEMKRIN